MDLNKKEFQIEIAGKPLTITVSKLAEQANAAVIAQYGDTTVLATTVMGAKDKENIDYLPLVVDYEERFYAAGKIIGSRFIRREGRPSEDAVLSGRLIDRTIRPLFNHSIRRDIQVVLTVLSYDEQNDPDFVALFAASTALMISDIPWNGPVSGIKMAKMKSGELILNPENEQIIEKEKIVFEAFIGGTENKINMIELSGYEAQENEVVESFATAHSEIKKMTEFQKEIVKEIGKPKAEVKLKEINPELKKKAAEFINGKLEPAVYTKHKTEQHKKIEELKTTLKEYLVESGAEDVLWIENFFEEEIDAIIHKNILEKELRPDGRKLDEVRSLHAQIGLFKRLHGSSLFIRGGTQALVVTTLAAPGAEQLVETMEASSKRRFMLHYNFPPYSTGEIGRMGAPGRREIGHGALAEKAIKAVLPSQEEFPYTIRVVSEILASNGSSSMATTCASSLSLMDAGVPLKKHVAGIAMGIITDQQPTPLSSGQATDPAFFVAGNRQPKHKVLTDIQGPEDHYGDMDCKVAGTDSGINAIQMDVKINGITSEILKEVLIQAKKARLEILDVMNSVISKPKEKVSEYAPVVAVFEINPEQIGEVIGPGGKIINGIIKDTGVFSIDIEQNGKIFIAGSDSEKVGKASSFIQSLTKEFKIGDIVEGEVVRILEFGAIVDIGGGKDGMIHVSELKNGFVKKVEDVVKIGDFVRAKVIKTDNGKLGLSIKALSIPEEEESNRG
ncbi:MAG: polyribonucleotide nucleotidyltransferase [Patescibacteria group bacterium]|nr:polyribonucleotide nucleotidyltransferase [Patescibacteria group bacterium]